MSQRKKYLENVFTEVERSVGGVKKQMNQSLVSGFVEKRDLKSIVRLVKSHMNLQCRILVKRSHSSKMSHGRTLAQIQIPQPCPLMFSPEFKKQPFYMEVNSKWFATAETDYVMLAISHELSHIILKSLGNKYAHCETATDICAMILGFSDSYKKIYTRDDIDQLMEGVFDRVNDHMKILYEELNSSCGAFGKLGTKLDLPDLEMGRSSNSSLGGGFQSSCGEGEYLNPQETAFIYQLIQKT